MVKGKIFLLTALLLIFAGTAWARLIPDPDVQGKIQDARQSISLKGRVVYQEVGGYILRAEGAGDKIILNQNYEVLKKLARKHQEVCGGRPDQSSGHQRPLYLH